jgi:hypothetical protein
VFGLLSVCTVHSGANWRVLLPLLVARLVLVLLLEELFYVISLLLPSIFLDCGEIIVCGGNTNVLFDYRVYI